MPAMVSSRRRLQRWWRVAARVRGRRGRGGSSLGRGATGKDGSVQFFLRTGGGMWFAGWMREPIHTGARYTRNYFYLLPLPTIVHRGEQKKPKNRIFDFLNRYSILIIWIFKYPIRFLVQKSRSNTDRWYCKTRYLDSIQFFTFL